MSNLKIFLLFFIILVESMSVATAKALNTDDIERFAEQFITLNFETDENDELDVKAHNIDPRVNISSCSQPLMGNLSTKRRSRSQIVEVSCPSPDTPWKMYVPVKIRHMVPVVVSLVQLDKGARINENNIEVVYRDKMSLRRQAHTNTDKFYGAKTKRRVSAGQIIGRQNICFVCKGETVTIEAKSDSLSIKTLATALSDGALWDKIRVRNKQSGKIIEAQVISVDRVVVNI